MPILRSSVDASLTAPEFGAVIRDSLKGLWIFRHTVERSRVNLAPGKPVPDATVVGDPTMTGDTYAIQFKSLTNFFETSMPEYPSMTVYLLARSLDDNDSAATRPAYFGTRLGLAANGVATFGFAVYISASGAVRAMGGFGNDTNDDESVTDSVTKTNDAWDFIVAKVDAANKSVYIKNLTQDTAAATDTSTLPRFTSAQTLRIGSGYQSDAGTSEMSWLQVHDKVLSEGQDQAVYAQVKAYQQNAFGRTI